MAGIGFELKKLFRRKGLLAGLRAYGCAGILCTGPMLLGVLLQLGILVLCSWAGAAKTEQDLLVCMVTDTLLASLTVTSLFAMPVTRFLADMLYEEQEQLVLPSFWGANALLLAGGCGLYGLFLLVSGATTAASSSPLRRRWARPSGPGRCWCCWRALRRWKAFSLQWRWGTASC